MPEPKFLAADGKLIKYYRKREGGEKAEKWQPGWLLKPEACCLVNVWVQGGS